MYQELFFKKCILLIMLLQFSQFFHPFISLLCPVPHHPLAFAPQFMSMGGTYRFFGFSISCTILNLPPHHLFCTYNLCFLSPVPFPHSPPFLSPLITLHAIFISPILFLFQSFAQFVSAFFFLGSLVDSYEFVVILLFIVFDLLFLR